MALLENEITNSVKTYLGFKALFLESLKQMCLAGLLTYPSVVAFPTDNRQWRCVYNTFYRILQ